MEETMSKQHNLDVSKKGGHLTYCFCHKQLSLLFHHQLLFWKDSSHRWGVRHSRCAETELSLDFHHTKKCHMGDLMSDLEMSCEDTVLKFEVLCFMSNKLFVLFCVHSPWDISLGSPKYPWSVPLSHKGQVLVKEDYIYFLVEVANQKMEENVKQIERFYEWLQSALQPAEPQSPSRQETEEKSVYKQRRKRGQTNV
ncbi:unnamed protein product [Oncorhynchus mykiss]|uniref:tRNA wybutosine-synthesizing protein 3 homolog n=1 Tax=Oncorhynchus mykiss TaxID=8022 RepID=A0A060VV57_ONCMY|nr:unnamed protein product [Oncorhynchus mykiss]